MANNFNIRRSIANYADNIQDGSERLADVLIQDTLLTFKLSKD